MNYSLNSLKVLLWKHFVVRKRRFISTTIELVSPLIFFIILFSIRGLLQDNFTSSEHFHNDEVSETIPFKLNKDLVRVIFAPANEATHSLMQKACERLNLPLLDNVPDHLRHGCWASNDTAVLNKFSEDIKYNEAIVVIQDTENGLPRKLNYTIRIKEDYQTGLVAPSDGTFGPHERYGTIYDIFMSLQWAIDSSFIELLSGSPLAQTPMFQEFPYASNRHNKGIEIIASVIQLSCYISMLLPFVFLFSRLLDERCAGIQELIKMVSVTPNILGISHFCNMLPTVTIFACVGTILLKVSDTPVLPNTSATLIVIALFLHALTIISMAFAASYLPSSMNYCSTIATILYMLLWLPRELIKGRTMNRVFLYLTGLFPHTPIYWFWDEVAGKELYDEGLQITDIFSTHSKSGAPVAFAYFMMLVQILVFFLLTWYLDKVRPGPYGVAAPWNFLCQKHYWTGLKVSPDDVSDEGMVAQGVESRFFEEPPADLEVGIKIVNVSKIYGAWHGPKTVALSNLSLNIYKGEITVLVGHNGAGKTTLMSIITGMTGATEGEVYVNGKNTAHDMSAVRRDLGLCTQHNITFYDLTVQEHLVFFAMLKGLSYAMAKKSSANLLAKLKLEGKENSKSCELSGGMKRRLQLACALAGDASVLILDEPTSGLDVETRRELWDLLLGLRGSCTVLISTHFMEEADALGDRVAAIHAGKLRSAATPMFLKRAIGTGYRLSLTVNRQAEPNTITETIQRLVPDATLTDQTSTTLTYKLPSNSSEEFPELFNVLEQDRATYGIETIGVGVTTLEEVFLKLCSDVDCTDFDVTSNSHGDTVTTFAKLNGFKLYYNIISILVLRQIRATLSMKWQFLLLQCILPILSVCLFTYIFNNAILDSNSSNTPATLNLDLYKQSPHKMFYYFDKDDVPANILKDGYENIELVESRDVINDISSISIKDKIDYNKYLLGVTVNSTDANIYFTTVVRHAAPVALNVLSNVFAAKNIPWADSKTITTINHPIESSFVFVRMIDAKTAVNCYIWAVMIVFLIMATLTNEVTLPCKERVQGSRHYHIMSGCPPVVYWMVTYLYDLVVYAIVVIVPLVIACEIFDYDSTFTRNDFLGALFGYMLVGGMVCLVFVYFVSFFFAERAAGMVLSIVSFVFGMIAPLITVGSAEIESGSGTFARVTNAIGHIFPPYLFTVGAMKITSTARFNAYCHLNKASCPNIADIGQDFDVDYCCASTSESGPYDYLVLKYGGYELIVLYVHLFIYGMFVLLLEYGVWNRILDKIFNFSYKPPERKYHDQFASKETDYVDSKFLLSRKTGMEDAAMVNNLHKRYTRMFKKPTYAVRGTSFSVKKGECFGLLGVNGAGKSTTFKMLTAEEAITRGDVYVDGTYLRKNRSKYLYGLGYCPQFGGLDPFLSGYENLRVLLTIRGLKPQDVQRESNAWIHCVGLEHISHRPLGTYSGGCNRRLAAAAALSSDASVSLLDEPTAGVDTAARRRVWAALKRALAQDRSIIITSHSMDEMEALCHRIAIMSEGEICALGTPAVLRAEHAAGYALRLKLKHTAGTGNGDETDSTNVEMPINKLKRDIQQNFQTQLKDEHKTMLHYHINDKVPYSQLFRFLENLKHTYGALLEDYSITETTLEEVFLSFAKHDDGIRGENMA